MYIVRTLVHFAIYIQYPWSHEVAWHCSR